MSPAAAEAVVLNHLATSLPALTDTRLAEVAAEHAVEQGHYAAEARRLIDAEVEYRQAVKHEIRRAVARELDVIFGRAR